MEMEEYKELVNEYILSLKKTLVFQPQLLKLYEQLEELNQNLLKSYKQLKELNQKDLIKVFKLIVFIKKMLVNENHQKIMNTQLNDELSKDIKAVLNAHKINMKMLGYSPLIGVIFNYYVYTKHCTNNKKIYEHTKELETQLNQGLSNELRNSTDRIVKKFYRLNYMRFGKHNEILISDRRKKIVQNNIEKLYKKKIHKDTFYILFVKVLFEAKLLSLANSNAILKIIFDISQINYIDENNLQKDEVVHIANNSNFTFSLPSETNIIL